MPIEITDLVHGILDSSQDELSLTSAILALRERLEDNLELRVWLGDLHEILERESKLKDSRIAELVQDMEAKDAEIARLTAELSLPDDKPETPDDTRKIIKRAREQRGTPHKNFRIPLLRLLHAHGGSIPDFIKRVQTDPTILGMEFLSADLEIFNNKKPRWVTNIGNQAGDMQKEGLLNKRSHGVWSLTEKGMREAEQWQT